MPGRALAEAEIVRAAPSFIRPGRNWSGMCEAAQFNLVDVFTPGYVQSFPTATAARLASKIEGSGFGPGGNFVWMTGVWGVENGRRIDYGHVAYHVGGGLLFMASTSVREIPGFTALGFIDGPTYMRRFPGQTLVGWSWDHGGTIIPEEDMPLNDADKAWIRQAVKDEVEIGAAPIRARAESLKKTIQEEGALLKVLFNRASGIYSLASVGLKYWWELGQDINKATPQETWQARKEFGEATLAIYRERGFAQTWVHELDEEEWNFYRMLCTNTPTNPSDENLAHLASVIAKQGTILEALAEKLGVSESIH